MQMYEGDPRLSVSLEGCDFTGKDTQADLLADYLRKKGQNPLRINEPDESLPTGKLIREYLKDGRAPKAHAALFLANRLEMFEETVYPALRDGRPIVSSRSFLSSLVYQQEQYFLDDLVKIHCLVSDVYIPDYFVVLDLDAEEAMKRGRDRPAQEFYEKLERQKKNRERFLSLPLDLKGLWDFVSNHIKIVDASGTPEEVHQLILKALELES